MSESLDLQLPWRDLATTLDEAINPRPVAPGFVTRGLQVANPISLPPWFIDRCRQAYLRIPSSEKTGARLIGVTSALHGEGKSSIAIGIATAIAVDTREATVLLECDLERPSFHRFFGFPAQPGLAEWLDGIAPLRVARAAMLGNQFVIPAGGPPADPARLFYRLSDSGLMDELRPRFQNIVVDLPPMLDIAYSSLASRLTDHIILVAKYGVTPVDDLEKVVFLLGHERLSGIVLNGTEYKTPNWIRRLF
jgi:Mrp family chromosome partitioning ATPase